MAAALIVIEIAAPKVSDAALAVLVSACSRAARDAECALARNANDEQPAAVAIVTLQSDDKMRVEVGVRQGDHDSWRTKDFAFLPADQSMDRWRAVGFAIGTLAESNPPPEEETRARVAPSSSAAGPSSPGAATSSSSSPPSPSSTRSTPSSPPSPSSRPSGPVAVSPDEPPSPAPPARERARGTQMFVGAAAIFGPGLDTDPPWRVGSTLYADLAWARAPVFLTVGGTAATRVVAGSHGVTTRWFDVYLGAGVPLLGPLQGSGLELRTQLLAEYFDAHASAIGRSQTSSRWMVGVQGAFGGRLQLIPDLFVTAEVQAARLSGDTEVFVGRDSIGSSASFRYLGSIGLRVRLR